MGVRPGLSPRVSCEQAPDEVHLGTAELQSRRGLGPAESPQPRWEGGESRESFQLLENTLWKNAAG